MKNKFFIIAGIVILCAIPGVSADIVGPFFEGFEDDVVNTNPDGPDYNYTERAACGANAFVTNTTAKSGFNSFSLDGDCWAIFDYGPAGMDLCQGNRVAFDLKITSYGTDSVAASPIFYAANAAPISSQPRLDSPTGENGFRIDMGPGIGADTGKLKLGVETSEGNFASDWFDTPVLTLDSYYHFLIHSFNCASDEVGFAVKITDANGVTTDLFFDTAFGDGEIVGIVDFFGAGWCCISDNAPQAPNTNFDNICIGGCEIFSEPEDDGNIIATIKSLFERGWGISSDTGNWLFSILIISVFTVGFAKIAKTPLIIATGIMLGMGVANVMDFLPDWVLFVFLFIVIAVAANRLFEKGDDEE